MFKFVQSALLGLLLSGCGFGAGAADHRSAPSEYYLFILNVDSQNTEVILGGRVLYTGGMAPAQDGTSISKSMIFNSECGDDLTIKVDGSAYTYTVQCLNGIDTVIFNPRMNPAFSESAAGGSVLLE